MPDYATLKLIHQTCAAISVAGFMLRWRWVLTGSPLARHRLARTLPHGIDTLLLLSAVAMAVQLGAGPWSAGWLPAKLIALVVYVVLGALALGRAGTPGGRVFAGVGALAAFGYIVSVAITKSPWGALAQFAR